MSSEWPIKTDLGRGDASGRVTANDEGKAGVLADDMLGHAAVSARRLRDATTDLMLPARYRLSDRVRVLATSMLASVVGAAERDIRHVVTPLLGPETGTDTGSASRTTLIAEPLIAEPLLAEAGLLAHLPLIEVILRNAGMGILSARIGAARPERARNGLPIDDDDPGIAQAASALRVAAGRARDGFDEPTLGLNDLPAELAHRLVWQVAAALRQVLRTTYQNSRLDGLIGDAAMATLAAHDEGRSMEALAGKFARALDARGRLDDATLRELLASGEVSAFTAGLAARAGLPFAVVWNILDEPNDGRLALLLRAADIARDAAGAILMTFHDDARIEASVGRFDRTDVVFGRASIAPLALDAVYAEAIGALAATVPLARGSP